MNALIADVADAFSGRAWRREQRTLAKAAGTKRARKRAKKSSRRSRHRRLAMTGELEQSAVSEFCNHAAVLHTVCLIEVDLMWQELEAVRAVKRNGREVCRMNV
jgi:hypothetical protein